MKKVLVVNNKFVKNADNKEKAYVEDNKEKVHKKGIDDDSS